MTLDEFLHAADDLGERRRAEIVEAEAQFVHDCEQPLVRYAYPNTSYWDRMGPIIDGYRRQQRQDQLEHRLDQAIEVITAKYQALIMELEEQLCL